VPKLILNVFDVLPLLYQKACIGIIRIGYDITTHFLPASFAAKRHASAVPKKAF
jgi:hypothetical protein